MDGKVWGRWLTVSVGYATIICVVGMIPAKPELGSAINMLKRYGHLAENVRVMAKDVGGKWIYRERSVGIFKPFPQEFAGFFSSGFASGVVLTFNVYIKFCSNFRDLVTEYFRGFEIAGVDDSSRAFSSDWSKSAISKLFGIDESFVGDEYAYVFLKIARSRDSQRMLSFIEEYELEEAVHREVKNVEINDTDSADRFINRFGTHYVSSFATGDFIYQVYVDTPSYLRYLKNHISRTGLAGMDAYERDLMFSPWHTLHIGKILSASGNRSIEAWAEESLEGWYRNERDEKYSSIVQIYSDSQFSTQLDQHLQDNALLRMNLEILTPVFNDPMRREWFEAHVRKRLNQSIAKLSNKQ